MTVAVTPLEALRRCVAVLKQVDYADCGESEALWCQHALALSEAEAVLRAPDRDEELAKVKSDVEGLMGYGFMVDNRRVGMDRIVWFNRPGEQRLHTRPLSDKDDAIQDEFNEWIGPRRSGESSQEAAVLYWAQEGYRAGRLAAPVVPVAAQPIVPEGWKLVPEKPTPKMVDSTWGDNMAGMSHNAMNKHIYAAMLAAAPSLEAQPAGEVIPAEKLCALLPGTYYMDPPDGGSVTVLEQVERMAKDAARYRFIRTIEKTACFWPFPMTTKDWKATPAEIDAGIDNAMAQGEKQ